MNEVNLKDLFIFLFSRVLLVGSDSDSFELLMAYTQTNDSYNLFSFYTAHIFRATLFSTITSLRTGKVVAMNSRDIQTSFLLSQL
jgi:hypothetical protein